MYYHMILIIWLWAVVWCHILRNFNLILNVVFHHLIGSSCGNVFYHDSPPFAGTPCPHSRFSSFTASKLTVEAGNVSGWCRISFLEFGNPKNTEKPGALQCLMLVQACDVWQKGFENWKLILVFSASCVFVCKNKPLLPQSSSRATGEMRFSPKPVDRTDRTLWSTINQTTGSLLTQAGSRKLQRVRKRLPASHVKIQEGLELSWQGSKGDLFLSQKSHELQMFEQSKPTPTEIVYICYFHIFPF